MVVGWMNGLFDSCLFFFYDVDDFLSLSCFVPQTVYYMFRTLMTRSRA